jgi:DnaK suppressor protein
MTRQSDVRKIREELQRRRRDLLENVASSERELQALNEREKDPEPEENAQADTADFNLRNVIEGQRREIHHIDAALQRMDEGSFGLCIDCGEEIAIQRLHALPYALTCEDDAARREREKGARDQSPSL